MLSLILQDGTWSTVMGCFTIIRDFNDVCFHSYFSIMDELRARGPPDAKYYEIRFVLAFKDFIVVKHFVIFKLLDG